MIQRVFVVCVIGCALLVVCIAAEDDTKKSGYETKYDNIDLDELLGNDRLRKNYVKCLVGQGPCTPDAQELKSNAKKTSNSFSLLNDSIRRLKDFLVRLTSRRDSHELLKMHRKAKEWLGKGHTLSDRPSA